MNSEEIKNFIVSTFDNDNILPKQRKDGWSFYLNEDHSGKNSNRIARAAQRSINSPTYFKLAVSSRLKHEDIVEIDPSKQRVYELFGRELELWKENFK